MIQLMMLHLRIASSYKKTAGTDITCCTASFPSGLADSPLHHCMVNH